MCFHSFHEAIVVCHTSKSCRRIHSLQSLHKSEGHIYETITPPQNNNKKRKNFVFSLFLRLLKYKVINKRPYRKKRRGVGTNMIYFRRVVSQNDFDSDTASLYITCSKSCNTSTLYHIHFIYSTSNRLISNSVNTMND